MDFLNQAIKQLTDLFQQMTPAARITAGLLLVTIVCSLFYLFRTHSSSADEYLFGGESFSQRDLANMETAFAKDGAIGSQIEGNKMKVPRGKKELFLKSLRANDAMPENFINHNQKAVANDNPFNATASRNNAMKTAKERELARVVRSIKGIDEANVMYDETMTGSFPRRMERRASIAVKAQGSRSLTEEEIKTVRNMVIGAVGSLKTSDVTVVDLNAGRAYPGGDGSASDNLYATTKRMFEESYRDKIATQLSMVPGVVVGVNVELDPEISHSSNGVEVKGKPFDLQKNSTEKVTPVILNTPGGGRPGASPNALGNSPQAVTVNQVTSSEPATETRTDTRSMPSYQQTQSQKAPLVPNSVTASVDIPSSYFAKVWKERNPPEKGAKDEKKPELAELKKIEDETKLNIEAKVASILPAATNGQKLVTVTSFTELAGPVLAGSNPTDVATSWLSSNWQTLAMIGLAIGSLLFVRGMVNSGPPEPASSPEAATPGLKIANTDDHEDDARKEADPSKRKFRTTGPNLRAELTDLVKEDPDTAANILKSWIGEAA